MILVLSEMIYMALAVMVLTLLFRKVFMKRMGMSSGILPIMSAAISVALTLLAKKYLNYQSTDMLLWMSSPISGWMWDAFLKYFFKKE